MRTKFIEATDATKFNWGKFLVAAFEAEDWHHSSLIDPLSGSLLGSRGWGPNHRLVVDLQTGEGCIFSPSGYAPADLQKHAVWVCPMFEPFLVWLYKQDLSDISKLPSLVDLGKVPTAMSGYRRPGIARFVKAYADLCRASGMFFDRSKKKPWRWVVSVLQGDDDHALKDATENYSVDPNLTKL